MKLQTFFAMLITVVVASIVAFAQNQAAQTNSRSQLAFTIEPVKAVYSKGESVEINVHLSNHSRDKILVAKSFQLNLYVNLDISDSAGKSVDWCGRIIGQIDSPRSFITLAPGESLSKKLVISCTNKEDRSRAWGYALAAPGKYVLAGTYQLPQPKIFFKKFFPNVLVVRGPVSAEPVTVEIR